MNALTVISWEVFVSLMWCVLFLVFNPVDMFVFAFSWVRPETISLLWLENRVILFHSHLAFLNLELQLLAKIKACFWLLNMPASVSCDTKSEIKNRNTTQHEKGTVKSVNVKKPSCCFSPFFLWSICTFYISACLHQLLLSLHKLSSASLFLIPWLPLLLCVYIHCRCWELSAGNIKWIYQVPILTAIGVRPWVWNAEFQCCLRSSQHLLFALK